MSDDPPRWTGALVREGDFYVGWLLENDGRRIDLRGAVAEVDGRRQFALRGWSYLPEHLRVPPR